MKTPLRQKRNRRMHAAGLHSFSLIEMSVAMIVLSLMAGMIAFSAASIDRSLMIMDINSALSDELSRQAEIAKSTPSTNLDNLFGTAVGISTTFTIPTPGLPGVIVKQLQGFLPMTNSTGPMKPDVTWTRFRTNYGLTVGHTALMDRITITAAFKANTVQLSNSTVVIKVFDANQQ
jgi:hypothetical protein